MLRLNYKLKPLRIYQKIHQHCIHHIAIVGSGPSGFYTAKYLTEQNLDLQGEEIVVDIIEQLPVPYGLVRYGVAPDHEDTKAVMTTFEEIASRKNVNFFGNVKIGDDSDSDYSITELMKHYSGVILCYGASSERKLNIPGESEYDGIITSRNFVNWYNGHPNFVRLSENLNLKNVNDIVIIGMGNVAIDCARILSKSIQQLHTTDISDNALNYLKHNKNKKLNISIVARRSHVQVSFCRLRIVVV